VGLEIAPEHHPARFADAPTFHPTFLYEIGWNLALAAALVWLGRRRRIRPPGLFALYVAGYWAFRIVPAGPGLRPSALPRGDREEAREVTSVYCCAFASQPSPSRNRWSGGTE
jgi:hypothetical protein